MRVERFALFFPPLVARWRPKHDSETEYAIGAIPLGGYVKITGMSPQEDIPPEVAHRAYFRQAVWKRIVVISAGPVVNIVLAFLILWVLFLSEGKPVPGIGVLETQAAPATQVLKDGDRILSADGVRGYAPGLSDAEIERRMQALRKVIGSHTCAGRQVHGCRAAKPVRMVVERDGRRLALNITPRYDAQAKRMLVGFSFGAREDLGPVAAARTSVSGMWNVTTTTVDRIVRIFYDSKARDEVSGVVGSYEATRQSFEFDTVQAVSILALISLSLGIINLFPFLPLDGGHIFWAVAEKLRGRAISFHVMERASIVGFMLVLFLFYVGLSNDIGRLSSGEGFGVR
jgi:regulator of sigma E protease